MRRSGLIFICACVLSFAQPVPFASNVLRADDQELKKRIQDLNADKANHWIYNDIAAGFAVAKKTGKPLLITFRCVPCTACMGFDAEVADGNEAIKELARKEFVCVRQVEMKGVDLTQFQFDHDLNWAAMFLNADGTIYARYGTQSEDGPDAFNSTKGLVNTMKRVLALHANYPDNAGLFQDKKPPQKDWKTARGIGTLNPSIQVDGQTSRSNCIHCHNIHDAENELWAKNGTLTKDELWRYPLPANIGLEINVVDGRTIKRVLPNGPAAAAGVESGKTIEKINGQAMSSIADMQWVLHHQPNSDKASVTLEFTDGSAKTISLARGWKVTDISWRGSLYALRPRIKVWMPRLGDDKRKSLNIAEGDGALQVKWINSGAPAGKAARKAGLKNGDVIVKLFGKPVPDSHAKFNAFVKLNYKVGDTLDLTILRGGKEKLIKLPLVE